MSKRRAPKKVAFVPCPTCGQPMGPQVAAMVGQAHQKTRRPTRRRRSRSRVQRFESSVAALPVSLGQGPPIEQRFDPIDEAPLSPGEKRSSKLYHQWSTGDVWVSGLLALVSGSLAGISAVGVCIAVRGYWKFVPIVWLGTTTIVWGVKIADFFDNDKAITSIQTHERPLESAPIVVEPPAAEIVINSGHKQTRAKLKAPKTNHAGLWQYADALLRETAAPSYEGGKEVLGAKAYGYTPAEFDAGPGTWRPTAIAGGILEEDPHKSKGYRLTGPGKRALAVVVERRLGEWG